MTTTLAACQTPNIQNDTESSLQLIEKYTAIADENAVDILCFPECFLQGYTTDVKELNLRAIDLQSKEFSAIKTRLSKYNTAITFGLIELKNDTHDVFNTAITILNGQVLSIYRKVNLLKREASFSPGNEYTVFGLKGIHYGTNICYDANFEHASLALAQQGAKVILMPLNNMLPIETAERWKDRHILNLQDRAKSTGCWIVSADIQDRSATQIGYGPTAIVDPKGKVVAKAKPGKDLIISTINT